MIFLPELWRRTRLAERRHTAFVRNSVPVVVDDPMCRSRQSRPSRALYTNLRTRGGVRVCVSGGGSRATHESRASSQTPGWSSTSPGATRSSGRPHTDRPMYENR